jgi:probable HAF family extracellular repeat protein
LVPTLIYLPFVWQKGVRTPLPTLGGNNGGANGFNSRNQVVGSAENTTPDPTCAAPQVTGFKPVIWEDGEIEQELPTLSGDPDGIALAINDRGQVIGVSGNCTTAFHAVLWQNDTVTDLGNLGGTGVT